MEFLTSAVGSGILKVATHALGTYRFPSHVGDLWYILCARPASKNSKMLLRGSHCKDTFPHNISREPHYANVFCACGGALIPPCTIISCQYLFILSCTVREQNKLFLSGSQLTREIFGELSWWQHNPPCERLCSRVFKFRLRPCSGTYSPLFGLMESKPNSKAGWPELIKPQTSNGGTEQVEHTEPTIAQWSGWFEVFGLFNNAENHSTLFFTRLIGTPNPTNSHSAVSGP